MTPATLDTWCAIERFMRRNSRAPSNRELATSMGLHSVSNILVRLAALENAGIVYMTGTKARRQVAMLLKRPKLRAMP